MQFQEIPIGEHFEFLGRRYKKLALRMASDEDRYGNIFQAQTEVFPDPFAPPASLAACFGSPQPMGRTQQR